MADESSKLYIRLRLHNERKMREDLLGRTRKGTRGLADGAGSRRSFGSCWAGRFLQMMTNGDGRASDRMRIGQLLLIGAFDGHRLTESQWPALGSDVATGRADLLAAPGLLSSVAETTDGSHGYQEQRAAQANTHHSRSADCNGKDKHKHTMAT